MDKQILKELSAKLYALGKPMGFSLPVIRSDKHLSEVYVVNGYALQLEIDWRENDLFMYVVYLRDNALPDNDVIYHYQDGHWCRKYIEEVYRIKRPNIKHKGERYSREYLFDRFEFYAQHIKQNPIVITKFCSSID